ncbi:MAG: phosphoribosyltransferase [Bradymonadaceae bacterium]
MNNRYDNRREAGRRLAQRLDDYRDEDVVVVGLARGGIPVASEVTRQLRAPLDVIVVRKLGAPGREELAMGAVAPDGVRVLNDSVIAAVNATDDQIAEVQTRETDELERRIEAYRGERERVPLEGRTVILVDDGLATGASMRAAVEYARSKGPARIVIGVPTGSDQTCESLAREVDELICPYQPHPFFGVSQAYRHFPQTTDDEVQRLLAEGPRQHA